LTSSEKDLVEELVKIKQQVEHLLEKHPDARNNDFYLSVLWLREFGGLSQYISFIPYDLIRSLSGKTESVSRARRKIQNEDHRYLPTDPKVLAKRRQREEDYRKGIHQI